MSTTNTTERGRIYAELSRLFGDLARIEGVGAPASNGAPTSRYAVAAGAVADDRELDSPMGNPQVRKDPPRWGGDSMVGRTLSECSAEFLECFAEFKTYTGSNPRDVPNGAKYAEYDLKDAARARGHARRNAARGGTYAANASRDRDGAPVDSDPGPTDFGDAPSGGGADEDFPFNRSDLERV